MKDGSTEKRPLDEVMLAMDVVDTLRHRQMLVERELHTEDHDRRLIERLREIYASQGIEVPDHVLAEGVAALAKERFVYQPPQQGLWATLARIYVNRGRWSKGLGMALLALAALWGGYRALVTGPAERKLDNQAQELNTAIRGSDDRLGELAGSIERLKAMVPTVGAEFQGDLAAVAGRRRTEAQQALNEAEALLGQAREVALSPDLEGEAYETRGPILHSRLEKRQGLLSRADQEVKKAQGALDTVASLRSLPQELESQRGAVAQMAKVREAVQEAEERQRAGMAALQAGDVEAAAAAVSDLKQLRARLEEEYDLRIVSRPNQYSGVWRNPEGNAQVRNYYVIVEAVRSDGSVLTRPIVNEEDGQTHRVSLWGLRVGEDVFQRVAADKRDDGIIQNSRVGQKRRGYLEPEYFIATTGAAITSW